MSADGRAELRVVVSIHDVAPASTDEVRLLLRALDELRVRPRALKAVPHAAGDPPWLGLPLLLRERRPTTYGRLLDR